MRPSPGSKQERREAFTLVELLVGLSVLVLLVAMLMSTLGQVTNLWVHTEGQHIRLRNGRLIADAIRGELRAALLPIVSGATAGQANLQFVLNPGTISQRYCNPSALFWQMPLATDLSSGDLAEVGYFVKWDNESNPTNPRANLCRFFVNPSDAKHYQIYSARTQWLNDELLESVAPANDQLDPQTGRSNGFKGLIAENVIGFWIRCASPNAINNSAELLDQYNSRSSQTPGLPKFIELSLVLLDEVSAARIGPQQAEQIRATVGASSGARACVAQLQADPGSASYRGGLRAFETIVTLENAK